MSSEGFPSITVAVRAALLVFASLVALAARGESVTLFDSVTRGQSADCTAHIISRGSGREITGRCGVPVDVPFDDPVAYVSSGWEINPFVTDVSRGGEFMLDQLVAAASVSFSSDVEISPSQRAIVVAFSAPYRRVFQHPVVDARLPRRVPAGQIVAVVVDSQDRALRLSPLVSALHRQSRVLKLRKESSGSSLIAFLGAPPKPHRTSDFEKITLVDVRGAHNPKTQVVGSDMIVAVWYDLDGPGRVVVDSPTLWLPNAHVSPGRHDPLTLREALRVKPTLSVDVGALERFPDLKPKMSLALRNPVDGSEKGRIEEVAPGGTYAFQHVAPGAYQVALNVDGFAILKAADLTSGEDARVSLALEPIEVLGQVFRGRTPAEAELRFFQTGAPVVVKTASDGTFRTVVWRPSRYFIDVVPAGQPADVLPYRELVTITKDVTLELRVPAKRIEARVFDEATRQPLDGAMVSVRSSSRDAAGRSSGSVSTVKTVGGVALLPPVREGTAEINVTADGYVSPAPLSLDVDAAEGVQSIEIAIRRNQETANLEVRFADGRPAGGAELVVLTRGGAVLSWRGVANAEGLASVPAEAEGNFVIVRHRESASAIVPVASRAAIPPVRLAPAAPPLLVEVVRADGKRIGPVGANVTLWHGEMTLTGHALALFAGATAVTMTDGTWVARNLPRAPIRIAAARHDAKGVAAVASFATAIPYPWPAVASIRVVE